MKKIQSLLGILGILALIAGGVLYWVHDMVVASSRISLISGGVLVLISFILFIIDQRSFFTRRSTKYGINAILVIIIFFGIIILINFLSTRHKKVWDLTSNKYYSLSDQSLKVLGGLEQDIQILAFDRKEAPVNPNIQFWLDRYAYHSPKVKVDNIDPEREPQKAQIYGVKSFGSVVIVAGERRERIDENVTEEKITNAILRATKDETKKIYFITGHGEKNISKQQNDGYSQIAEALVDANFLVDSLLLLQSGEIPQDASLIIIAGPQYDYIEPELKLLDDYLSKGGKLFIMLDPGSYPNLFEWTKEWGLALYDNMVIDFSGMGVLFGASESMPVVSNYDKFSPITKEFSGATMFPMAMHLEKSEEAKGYGITELAKTGQQSWAETDYYEGKAKYDEEFDKKGNLVIGVTLHKPLNDGTESRIALLGDSDFIANGYIKFSGNRDLFLNTVNWLTLDEDLISIRPKEEEDRRVNMPASTQRLLFYILVIILPFICLLIGAIVWWRKRG